MNLGIEKSNGKGLKEARPRPQPQQELVIDLETWNQRSRTLSGVNIYGSVVEGLSVSIVGLGAVAPYKTSTYPRGRLTGPVQFLSKLISLWNLERDAACTLLGYEKSDHDYVGAILSGMTSFRGRDANERVTNLFKIRSALSSIFRDLKVENEWLRESQKVLGDQTPLQLILEGSMENLLRVRLLVERMSGL